MARLCSSAAPGASLVVRARQRHAADWLKGRRYQLAWWLGLAVPLGVSIGVSVQIVVPPFGNPLPDTNSLSLFLL